jgi:hypothetical protein
MDRAGNDSPDIEARVKRKRTRLRHERLAKTARGEDVPSGLGRQVDPMAIRGRWARPSPTRIAKVTDATCGAAGTDELAMTYVASQIGHSSSAWPSVCRQEWPTDLLGGDSGHGGRCDGTVSSGFHEVQKQSGAMVLILTDDDGPGQRKPRAVPGRLRSTRLPSFTGGGGALGSVRAFPPLLFFRLPKFKLIGHATSDSTCLGYLVRSSLHREMPHLPHRSRQGRNGFQGRAGFVQGGKLHGKFAHC